MRTGAAKNEKKEAGQDKENDTPAEDTVTEPVEVSKVKASTSDVAVIDVTKISTEPKTVGDETEGQAKRNY